jgi:hypothetical protein
VCLHGWTATRWIPPSARGWPTGCTRRVRQAGSRTWRTVIVYAVASLTIHKASAAQLAGHLRGHWGVENQLHYVRDGPGT